MSDERPEFLRVGLRRRGVSVRLRLRWDRSPQTCWAVCRRLPVDDQIWHAKYAHNEVYALVPAWEADPPLEWACAYPGPGDLMYIPHPPGLLAREEGRRLVDLAYFYERGNNLYGPFGPAIGSIFATMTAVEDVEAMAAACHDVWFSGARDEHLFIEAE